MSPKILTIIAFSLPMAAFPLVSTVTAAAPTASSVFLDEVVDVDGTIISVNHEQKTFSIESDGEHVPLSVNNETEYVLDGEPSSLEDAVLVGRHAQVTHKDGTAVRVEVQTEH